MSDPVKWERSHYTCIEADKRSLAADIREVAAYRDLIGMFVKREFVVKYKQTVLGPLWLILRPFITSLFHLFLFSGIAHIETGRVPGILFYIGSNAVWNYFAMTLTSNAGMFRDNAALFGKVYFPRLTVPVSNVLIAALQYGIEMMLFLIFYVWFFVRGEVAGSLAALAVIPAVLIHLGLLGLSCGIILSSLTTKYRDLSVLIQFGVQLWMYATPVVYPLAGIENPVLRTLILLNPVSQPVEIFRYAAFGQGTVVLWSLALSWAVTAVLLIAGLSLFSKVEKTFIDTV